MNAVRCFVGKKQKDRDKFLPQITSAIRATVSRSTNCTPNMMMLGREVTTPPDLMFGSDLRGASSDQVSYPIRLTANMRLAHHTARTHLKAMQRGNKRNYDLKLLERPYSAGDKVYVLDQTVAKGKSAKLRSPWKGPGIIIEVLAPYAFRVRLRNAVMVTHHDKLKPCQDRELPKWIAEFERNPSTADDGEADDDDQLYCLCQRPWEE
ncbi:uncharacterized protein LOC117100726 [Anneissia japonica]|uniref:uncharacterized protein LOC117100726 n=1 Tax=Anneissia japonica TaxID=1529436 RepID=UPI0014258CF5|nr:uncharacterized protein LOC117100726 [Anneissia japonica]